MRGYMNDALKAYKSDTRTMGAKMAIERQADDARRRNWAKRGPLTEAGRERLRCAALRDKPWLRSTGPRTAHGKSIARRNALKGGAYSKTIEPYRSIHRLSGNAHPERISADLARLWEALGEPAPDAPFDRVLEFANECLESRCETGYTSGIALANFYRILLKRALRALVAQPPSQ